VNGTKLIADEIMFSAAHTKNIYYQNLKLCEFI
jgi:hypothetical protein